MRPFRLPALLALLAAVGCTDDYTPSSSPPPPAPRRSPPAPPPSEPQPPPPPTPPLPAPEPETPEERKAPVDFNLDDVKGDKLTVHEEKEPRGREKLEHELIVYTCLATQFNEQLQRHLAKKESPLLHKPDDDLVLYVLWGDRLGDPQPQAIFDRKTRRIVVTAKWAGQGLMDTGTLYRGYGFQLGKLEAGEYRVWVRESTPVDKDGPKLTKVFTFRVVP